MIYETPTKLIILDNEEKAARINYVKNKIEMMKNLCFMQNGELAKVEIRIDRLTEANMNKMYHRKKLTSEYRYQT